MAETAINNVTALNKNLKGIKAAQSATYDSNTKTLTIGTYKLSSTVMTALIASIDLSKNPIDTSGDSTIDSTELTTAIMSRLKTTATSLKNQNKTKIAQARVLLNSVVADTPKPALLADSATGLDSNSFTDISPNAKVKLLGALGQLVSDTINIDKANEMFLLWKTIPANTSKTLADFIEVVKNEATTYSSVGEQLSGKSPDPATAKANREAFSTGIATQAGLSFSGTSHTFKDIKDSGKLPAELKNWLVSTFTL